MVSKVCPSSNPGSSSCPVPSISELLFLLRVVNLSTMLVTNMLAIYWGFPRSSVGKKPGTGLKAQNVVQLPEPETKADDHLVWSEGGHLGPAGRPAGVPLGTGVPGSYVTRGQAAGDNAGLLLSYLFSSSWAGDHSERVQKMRVPWWSSG